MITQTDTDNIGLVGLGIIGSAIFKNIQDSKFNPIGFDIDQKRIEELSASDFHVSSSLNEVLEKSSILISSLPNNHALDDTIDSLVQQTNSKVELLVETSTLSLDCKLKNKDKLNAVGIEMLDCPISGTGKQAETADIVLYASGIKNSYEAALPVLKTFSRESFFVGDFGNGTKVKLIANLLVSIHNVAAAEAISLGKEIGLDLNELFQVISAGAGTSKIFELRAPMMIQQEYLPATMKMSVWKKDIELIREMISDYQIDSPLFDITDQLYSRAKELELDELDTASVFEVLRASKSKKKDE